MLHVENLWFFSAIIQRTEETIGLEKFENKVRIMVQECQIATRTNSSAWIAGSKGA